MQEPDARVQRQAVRHVDDQVFDPAVDDTLDLLGYQVVVPVDPKPERLAVLEKVPAEKQVVALALGLGLGRGAQQGGVNMISNRP